MKLLRPVILAILLAGAFFYFTTWKSSPLRLAKWISRPSKVEITEAAGGESLDPDEQNNILVYRKNIPSVVNITSKAVTFDFFYGLVPQEGPGLGLRHRQGRPHPHQLPRDRRRPPGRSHHAQPEKVPRHGDRHRPARTTWRSSRSRPPT